MVSSSWIGCSATAAASLVVMRVSLLAVASRLAVVSLLAVVSRPVVVSLLAVASRPVVVTTAAATLVAHHAVVASASRMTCSVV